MTAVATRLTFQCHFALDSLTIVNSILYEDTCTLLLLLSSHS